MMIEGSAWRVQLASISPRDRLVPKALSSFHHGPVTVTALVSETKETRPATRWERRQNGEKERGERAQVHEMDKTERGRDGKRAHVYEMEYGICTCGPRARQGLAPLTQSCGAAPCYALSQPQLASRVARHLSHVPGEAQRRSPTFPPLMGYAYGRTRRFHRA